MAAARKNVVVRVGVEESKAAFDVGARRFNGSLWMCRGFIWISGWSNFSVGDLYDTSAFRQRLGLFKRQ